MNSKFLKIMFLLPLFCLIGWVAYSQEFIHLNNGAAVGNADIQRDGANITVSLDVDWTKVKFSTDRIAQVVPVLVAADDTLELGVLSVYGHNSWFTTLRKGLNMTEGENDRAWRRKDLPETYHFSASVPYESWMRDCRLMVNECVFGCCGKVLGAGTDDTGAKYQLPAIPQYQPHFVYLRPKAEAHKMRAYNASSFVDFPVSQTVIYPEYRNNPVELKKILSSIDSVGKDSDITVKSLAIKGFASPESSYENNYRLAKGRTASIKNYISKTGGIAPEMISTDFEPENWEGLRAFVEASSIDAKEEILAIIDNEYMAPDPKEALIRNTYPRQYQYLKDECYPALRKVDYAIEYEVREFKGIDELRAAYASDPSKLSQEEFYVLALSYEESSEEFHQLIKTAVKYYPKDEIANLNAANIAMQEGRMSDAYIHLGNAGNSAEAMYACGIYYALIQKYEMAQDCFKGLESALPQAQQAYDAVQNIIEISKFYL